MLPKSDAPEDKRIKEETIIPTNKKLEESKKPCDVLPEEPRRTSIRKIDINRQKLLAWCSTKTNCISVVDLETKHEIEKKFDEIDESFNASMHLREIPNTKFLVSVRSARDSSVKLEMFDLSQKSRINKISLEEISGTTGHGVAYNARRNLLGGIPQAGIISYHLFNIEYFEHQSKYRTSLLRKARWYSQYHSHPRNSLGSIDFHPVGEVVGTLDSMGICLIADFNTGNYKFHLTLGEISDPIVRCRWSTNSADPSLFIKYDKNKLNILDAEQQKLILTEPFKVDNDPKWTVWIDVSPSNENLLATVGLNRNIKIFDKREGKIVKTFEEIHDGLIHCVRWNLSGDMLASISTDQKCKLLDFKTGKVLYTGTNSGGCELLYCTIQ